MISERFPRFTRTALDVGGPCVGAFGRIQEKAHLSCCSGSPVARKLGAQAGGWHYEEELRESAEDEDKRIVAQELRRRKWDANSLAERRKGDPGKLAIARRLREHTTMTLAWIAQRLNMGTRTHLAHLLYWQHRNK